MRNEDAHMVNLLLQFKKIILGDALLHAAQTGNCLIVDMLLGRQDNGEGMEFSDSADFSSDITPIIVAAHNEHYEVIRLLLSRGHVVEKPHPPYCFCQEKCKRPKHGESLSESRGKYNAYRALARPSYIAHSSADPVLTAFQLGHELKMAAITEPEFKMEYEQLAEQCQDFAVSLLDQCRTTEEVQMMLHRAEGRPKHAGKTLQYTRVALAIDLEQKSFVAHPNCQQVLRGAWLGGWQDWRRLSLGVKLVSLLPRILFLPLMALVYLIAPDSKLASSWRSPFNKFLSFVASYIIFLTILFIQNGLDTLKSARGPPDTGLEWCIILYILGLGWRCVKQTWTLGINHYARHNWNLYDVLMVLIFMLAFLSWAWSAFAIRGTDRTSLPRKYWHQHDPTLIGEAFYAVAIILAFGKVTYFFQIGHRLGPFQISMGRMFTDIVNFLVVFMVIMLSFAVGLHKLYHHYTGQVRKIGGVEVRQSDAFETLTRSLETLYWAIYGYSPPYFADIIISEHYIRIGNVTRATANEHNLTQCVGHTLFALYYITGIIILINMLIAMMSTSFSKVQQNADTEWKFARTRVWLSFFEASPGTLPPPFNLIPSIKTIKKLLQWFGSVITCDSKASCSFYKCCYYEEETSEEDCDEMYELLMSRLIQRYLTSQQRGHLNTPMTVTDLAIIRNQVKGIRDNTRDIKRHGQDPDGSVGSLKSH